MQFYKTILKPANKLAADHPKWTGLAQHNTAERLSTQFWHPDGILQHWTVFYILNSSRQSTNSLVTAWIFNWKLNGLVRPWLPYKHLFRSCYVDRICYHRITCEKHTRENLSYFIIVFISTASTWYSYFNSRLLYMETSITRRPQWKQVDKVLRIITDGCLGVFINWPCRMSLNKIIMAYWLSSYHTNILSQHDKDLTFVKGISKRKHLSKWHIGIWNSLA